jgi:Proline racemase
MAGGKCQAVRVIDSRTGGQSNPLIATGGPNLGSGTPAARVERFHRHDDNFRPAVVNEPRGSDGLVGALLRAPVGATCAARVIFFFNTFNPLVIWECAGARRLAWWQPLPHTNRVTPGGCRVEPSGGKCVGNFARGWRSHAEPCRPLPRSRDRSAQESTLPIAFTEVMIGADGSISAAVFGEP